VIANITTLLESLITGYQGSIQSSVTLQTAADIYSSCLLMKHQLNESGANLLSYMLNVSETFDGSLKLFSQSMVPGIQNDLTSSLVASSIRANPARTAGVPSLFVLPIPRRSEENLKLKNVSMIFNANPSASGQEYFLSSHAFSFNEVLYNQSLLSRSDLIRTSLHSTSWGQMLPWSAVRIRIPIFISKLFGYEREMARSQIRCVAVEQTNSGLVCSADVSEFDQGVLICQCNWTLVRRRSILSSSSNLQSPLVVFAAQELGLDSCIRQYDCSDGYFLEGCDTSTSSSSSECKVYYTATQYFPCSNSRQASCRRCSSNCSAGFFISKQCEVNSDVGCSPCGAGTFSANGEICRDCLKGTFSDSQGQSACTSCSPGYFTDKSASHACSMCPPGSFAASEGSTQCTSCPDGSSTAGSGSTSQADCECSPGRFLLNGTCTPCPAGTFKDVLGNGRCQTCPLNYTSSAGSSQFSDCHCDPSKQDCSNCNAGTYQEGTKCSPCPLNSYSQPGSWLMTQCFCNKGYDSLAPSGCSACPAGKYKATSGNDGCKSCDHNTTTTMSAQASCVCVPGYYDASASGKCKVCPAGTYSSQRYGASSCLPCSQHSTSAPGSASVASCFCQPGYVNSSLGCKPCPAGSYQDSTTGACVSCPANHLSAPGSSKLNDCYSCKTCGQSQYVIGCNADNLGNCKQCTSCSSGQYLVQDCKWNMNRICFNCTVCSKTEYVSTPCSESSDTICSSCIQENCKKGYYWSGCDGISKGRCIKGSTSSFQVHLSTTAQFSYEYQVLFIKAVAETAQVSVSDVILLSFQQLSRRASYSYSIEFSIVNYASTLSENKLNNNIKKQTGFVGISNLKETSQANKNSTSAAGGIAAAPTATSSENKSSSSGSSSIVIISAAAGGGGAFLVSIAIYILYRRRVVMRKQSSHPSEDVQTHDQTQAQANTVSDFDKRFKVERVGDARSDVDRVGDAHARVSDHCEIISDVERLSDRNLESHGDGSPFDSTEAFSASGNSFFPYTCDHLIDADSNLNFQQCFKEEIEEVEEDDMLLTAFHIQNK